MYTRRSFARKTVSQLALNDETDTSPGHFAIIYEQMALLSSDGTLRPIYTGQATSPVTSMSGTTGITGAGNHIDINSGHAIYPQLTTLYFGQDHLGSSRTMTGGYGYPLWQSTFLPYGQEYNPQPTLDNLKFTGLEHDDETGLDHTLFRQYGGASGRWTAPDPYSGSMDITNPQSMNRYGYVLNDPPSLVDPLGLGPGPCPPGSSSDFCTFVNVPYLNGGGGDDGGGGQPLTFKPGSGGGDSLDDKVNDWLCSTDPSICPIKPPENVSCPAEFGKCLSNCLMDKIGANSKRALNRAKKIPAVSAAVGFGGCGAIVLAEPELAPAYIPCAVIGTASTAVVGAAIDLNVWMFSNVGSTLGCTASCTAAKINSCSAGGTK